MRMDQKPNDEQNMGSEETMLIEEKLGLPITALLLNIIPYLLFLGQPNVFILLLIGIFPIIGVVVGIVALCFGKKRIGKLGQVFSIIAIAWPIVFIITMVLLDNVGALTFNM